MQDIIAYFIQNLTALYIAVALVSLCIGSFLNVVIYRTPRMMEQDWQQECQMLL
ncbi:prepilin peptidase, partial [Acinetobacter baumannii]